MANRKDLNLHRYDIGRNEYRELYYFCRQYREKKARLAAIYSPSGGFGGGAPNGSGAKDPTAARAMQAMKIEEDVRLIEETARETAGDVMSRAILRNVCDGTRYEALRPPCGRNQFYELRRRFFFLLHLKKTGTQG